MAPPEEENAGPAVTYATNASDADLEKVEIKSPAKNRYKGTPLTPDTAIRRRSVFPVMFERADKTWWDPKFDSAILEDQHRKHYFLQSKRRFQYALAYIILSCAGWIVLFAAMHQKHHISFLSGCAVLLVLTAIALGFTFTIQYQRYSLETSLAYAILLCFFCLLNFIFVEADMSLVGVMVGATEIIILMYTVIPMSLYMCVIIGLVFSVIFEVVSGLRTSMNAYQYIIGRVLLHVCIHLVGIHIFFMSQARKRSTFLKVGQSILSRRHLEIEKQLKQRMIHSLMPPKVAEEIMKSREDKEGKEEEVDDGRHKHHGSKSPERGKMTFRSFHMSQMEDVSILFADIVGFTKMSSNKTAEHLVSLLNDLFGRFDLLCTACGCEKISTLGDCYYCVSGCPEPKSDHANCCIEMGLGMVKKIREFDEEHKEEVNMRVGVHTGSVLCGLVGTRRFKFDVWSNDVTLANIMESEGRPGMVHVSESTKAFVEECYEFEEGESVEDIRKHKVLIEDYNQEDQRFQVRHVQEEAKIKTFFVIGRKKKSESGEEASSPKSPRELKDGDSASADDVKLNMEDSKEDTQTWGDINIPGDVNDSSISQTNHVDSQADANGVSPALLLPGREKDESPEGVNPDLREQLKQQRRLTDQQLIHCIEEDAGVSDYLHHPPINQCTLNFLDNTYEDEYRNQYLTERIGGSSTFASPRVSAFFDMAVSFIFLVLMSVSCFVAFPVSIPWIVVFIIALLLEILMLLPLLLDVCFGGKVAESIAKITGFFVHWLPRHAFGAVLASLPAVAVYTNFSCQSFDKMSPRDVYYCLLLVVALLHYCNFTMMSSWMKSALATLAGIILLILLGLGACGGNVLGTGEVNNTIATTVSSVTTEAPLPPQVFSGQHMLRYEVILAMILLLLLIWFLNREFEISYRLSFHGDLQAVLDRQKMQQEKEQADWLLHNIIPEHVSEVLKRTSKYCKNHKDVGVIFAKVVNYDDFYDESFEGGREYYRVLNELIGDFEDLFDEPKYKDVEKIKTIGSCLMAASGLNPQLRSENKDPNAHLYALMDFAVDLLSKLEQFNMEIFNFNFEMAIGFNFGEVTAGVIGTTKLLYDIWGDTVNISSRMYSTGMPGKIQVTEDTAEKLKEKFEFEYRGKTFVKGKGDMKTFLLVDKKPGATWE